MRRRIDLRRATAWLVAAWLIPVTTHVLTADWLLPPLVLALTASLLRGGRTLLDRLVLASALLLGVTCGAGLLFMTWPFGMAPVPVAGTALTALGAVSLLTHRDPRLPRPRATDALTVVAALVAVGPMALPYLRTDTTGRLALLLGSEDQARHISIFETLRRLGGYAYAQSPRQVPDLYEMLRYYPSGWHLTAGLLDGFVRSSTRLGAMPGAIDHYAGFLLAGYGVLALALIWAAQWIAGPLLTFWRRLPLLVFLAVQLMYGSLATLPVFGFVSEYLGLTLLVLLVAVLARRPSGAREQVVLIGALLMGIGFAYELLLPPAMLAVAIWVVRRWRPLLRPYRVFVPVAVGLAGLVSVIPPVLGVRFGSHAILIQAPGAVLGVGRGLLFGVLLLVAAGVATTAGWRLRVWRSYAWTVLAVLTLPAAVQAYESVTGHPAPYYYEKTLHAVFVTALAGLGAVVLMLPRPRPIARQRTASDASRVAGRQRMALAAVLPPVLAAAAVAAGSGVLTNDRFSARTPSENISRQWNSGEPARTNRPRAMKLTGLNSLYPFDARGGDGFGAVTVVLTKDPQTNYLESVYLSMLQRTSGLTAPVWYSPTGFPQTVDQLADGLARVPGPVRLIIAPGGEQLVEQIRRLHPEIQLTVATWPD